MIVQKTLKLPDINVLLKKMLEVTLSFDGNEHKIKKWLNIHRKTIRNNKKLVVCRSKKNDIKILLPILSNLLVRATRGERGNRVFEELQKKLKSKKDLNKKNYKHILKSAKYRWGVKIGTQIISDVVDFFGNKLKWNWSEYFKEAEKHHKTNFQQDDLLKIKNISFKVRDLALSWFSHDYVANDLHVIRVMTRIGLLNYGFDLLSDSSLEMGNNPGNEKQYLFLHRLVHKLSRLTKKPHYSPSDLDRIFWSYGKSICGNNPKCKICPIKKLCLTGQNK